MLRTWKETASSNILVDLIVWPHGERIRNEREQSRKEIKQFNNGELENCRRRGAGLGGGGGGGEGGCSMDEDDNRFLFFLASLLTFILPVISTLTYYKHILNNSKYTPVKSQRQ